MQYEKYIKVVPGPKKSNILLFTLSTCGWCRKTKELLKELGVEYKYVDVDLVDDKTSEEVTQEVTKWNPLCSFPTIVVDNSKCIVGFDEKKIREAAGV